MPGESNRDFSTAILRTQQRIREHLASIGLETAGVSHFGSTDIDPKYLALCVRLGTDREAGRANPKELTNLARSWLKEEGYPPEAADQVVLRADSEETVIRDYDGNWYLYYK